MTKQSTGAWWRSFQTVKKLFDCVHSQKVGRCNSLEETKNFLIHGLFLIYFQGRNSRPCQPRSTTSPSWRARASSLYTHTRGACSVRGSFFPCPYPRTHQATTSPCSSPGTFNVPRAFSRRAWPDWSIRKHQVKTKLHTFSSEYEHIIAEQYFVLSCEVGEDDPSYQPTLRSSPPSSSGSQESDSGTPKYFLMDAGIFMNDVVKYCPSCGKEGPLFDWKKVSKSYYVVPPDWKKFSTAAISEDLVDVERCEKLCRSKICLSFTYMLHFIYLALIQRKSTKKV